MNIPSTLPGGELFLRLAGSVHNLERRASSELLLNITDDTHSDILISTDAYGHKLTVSFALRITLCCDEVANVSGGLEGVVQLDTRLGTVLCLQGPDRGTDVDV